MPDRTLNLVGISESDVLFAFIPELFSVNKPDRLNKGRIPVPTVWKLAEYGFGKSKIRTELEKFTLFIDHARTWESVSRPIHGARVAFLRCDYRSCRLHSKAAKYRRHALTSSG